MRFEPTTSMAPDGGGHLVVIDLGDILPGLGDFIEGAVTLEDGMILIYDLERFLRENGEFLFDHVVSGVPA